MIDEAAKGGNLDAYGDYTELSVNGLLFSSGKQTEDTGSVLFASWKGCEKNYQTMKEIT